MNHSTASPSQASRFEPCSETEARMSGFWLVLVRLVCLTLGVLSVGLFVASILSYIANHYLFCTATAAACYAHGQLTSGDVRWLQELGLSRDFIALYPIVLDSILSLGNWLVAALLFWRKSDDRVPLLAAVTLALFPIVLNYGLTSTLPSPWWFLANVLSFVGSLSFILFFLVFPSGHFVPSFTRWILVVALLYWGLNEFFPFPSFNPFYRFQLLNGLTYLGLVASVVVAQIYRYQHVSTRVERQQTKWVVYGMSLGWGGYLVLFTIALFFPSLFSTGSLISVIKSTAVYGLLLFTPLSLGFAILRSRLWD
ncbi:MAG TPA: hypothetical protein VFQ36_17850, partial [Ktedonobacteraceae bacterium]|nr:hypothetical protein [Ktedonobacteraceae bacterium]